MKRGAEAVVGVVAEVPCGADVHRVGIDVDGELVLLDHAHDDAGAALHALGDREGCFGLLDSWASHLPAVAHHVSSDPARLAAVEARLDAEGLRRLPPVLERALVLLTLGGGIGRRAAPGFGPDVLAAVDRHLTETAVKVALERAHALPADALGFDPPAAVFIELAGTVGASSRSEGPAIDVRVGLQDRWIEELWLPTGALVGPWVVLARNRRDLTWTACRFVLVDDRLVLRTEEVVIDADFTSATPVSPGGRPRC